MTMRYRLRGLRPVFLFRSPLRWVSMLFLVIGAAVTALDTGRCEPLPAPIPLIEKGHPAAWWFAFKFDSRSYPACAVGAQRSCPFGGTMQDYRGQFSQQFVFASSNDSELNTGTQCLGNSNKDPLGATFAQVYNGNYYYVVWNDQLYGAPSIPGCNKFSCSGPWAHSKGLLAWDDAGDGLVLQATTPSWPATGSSRFPRQKDGNTLGCMKVNNLKSSQDFFAVKLTKADVLIVLKAMSNASVATDPVNRQLVRNGGPADIQAAVRQLGTKSASTTVTDNMLSSGVRLISKPSRLHVPPWQMVSAILGGVPLRVATWWARPQIYSTAVSTGFKCWDTSLGKPGPVEIATSGYWAGRELHLAAPRNHAKIGVSTDPDHNFSIFGDLNQQGGLWKQCSSSQNSRGGLFYVVDNRQLAVGLRNLINGNAAPITRGIDQIGKTKDTDRTNSASLLLNFSGPVPKELRTSATVSLNGKEFKVGRSEGADTVTLLGRESSPTPGLNVIQALSHKFVYWFENSRLSAFADPYPSSYAIIAAIDDYDRKDDPLKRGPSGYEPLHDMVAKAKDLRKALLALGFPEKNIRTFYNQRATTQNLQDALKDFYEGGGHAGASRVLFYFGGHGGGTKGAGYLVTYDLDPKRPTATGFLMSDFVSRYFPLMQVKQFLAAIDSCSSGLAIPGMTTLGGEQRPKSFATLAQIEADTKYNARDLLVAGTGAEPAIAEAGGIFTKALIAGLKGDADLSKDGVIQFDELSFYVRNRVIAQARGWAKEQRPVAFKATSFGAGQMVFLLPEQQ